MPYLEVPGASLYHEITGTGPLLLLIPGGTDDTRDFSGLVARLASRYTVLSYDGRGMSRSRLATDPQNVAIETLSDDAYRLLTKFCGGMPAYVFGTSSGGQTALAVTARHPEMVRFVVAHEPPVAQLLDEGDPRRLVPARIRDTYLKRGVVAAIEVFLTGNGLVVGARDTDVLPESEGAATEMRARLQRIEANLPMFFAHVIEPASSYVPDFDVLGNLSDRIAVGVGAASAGQMAHDAGLSVASMLQAPVVDFPGGHAGFVSHPDAFARKLKWVLEEACRSG